MNEAEILDTVESTFCYCISDVIYFISEEIHKVITIKLWEYLDRVTSVYLLI